MLTWGVALALLGFVAFATGSLWAVPVRILGVWWLGKLLALFVADDM